ncbi:uncharacterized protein LOC127810186 [Diospyros lotus]|uniref:uncharacterized protein LOC127810186 n=1 Tax=Diospyros lotus TaxID=55363 RepID=UPI00224D43E9|nr:uncharacterized protein LOC127810186 [Diospyros lotus]
MSSATAQQQPVLVYPNTITAEPSLSRPRESFGTVFIVLAVVVVLSAVACCLARLCNRRLQRAMEEPAGGIWPEERTERKSHVFYGGEEGNIPTSNGFEDGERTGSKVAENGGLTGYEKARACLQDQT